MWPSSMRPAPSIIDNGVGGIDKFGNNDVAGHCYALIASLTGNYGKRGTGCGIYGYHVTPLRGGAWRMAAARGHGAGAEPPGLLRRGEGRRYPRRDVLRRYPPQKAANWNKTLEWLDSLDFVCLADIYHSSVTDFVDLVLPCAASSGNAPIPWAASSVPMPHLGQFEGARSAVRKQSRTSTSKGIAEAMGLGDLFRPMARVRPGASDHR